MTATDRAAAPSHEAIAEQAAFFFQRRRLGPWTEVDQAELVAWCTESTLNEVAYLRLEGAIAYAERLNAQRPFRHGFAGSEPSELPARRKLWLPLALAASVVLSGALGLSYLRSLLRPPPDRIFGTNVGGHAVLKFADGTEVELNTNTALRYRMTTQERTIWLERGEAYFRVAHNPIDPFTVVAAGHRITDIGTEFLVRDEPGRLEVTLVKGKAKLVNTNAAAPVAMLAPGDDAVATAQSTMITKKTPAQLADELAWQQGMLIFRKTHLSDAVREFNRYNDVKLVVGDPSIADLTFSAEIRTDRYEDLVLLLQTALGLKVVRVGDTISIFRGTSGTHKRLRT